MPMALRRLCPNDLHHMCLSFTIGGLSADLEDFKKIVPKVLSAEDWFRFDTHYANGEPILVE